MANVENTLDDNIYNDIWDKSDVQGFSFDDIETKDAQLYSDALAKNFSGNIVEADFLPSPIHEDCTFCNNKLVTVKKYEDKATFCSENCWIKCIHCAISDLRSGGISSWPISMFTSLSAKRHFIELATETLDADFLLQVILIIKSRLNQDVFFSILLENELTYNQYVHYLKETDNSSELNALLLAHGNVEESKIFLYKDYMDKVLSVDILEAEKLMHSLRIFAVTELSDVPQLSALRDGSLQSVDLLKFQIETSKEWSQFCNLSDTLEFKPLANLMSELAGQIIGQSLSNTISACVLMDKTASTDSRAYGLKLKHNMADEQFRWLVLEPLIGLKLWSELDMIILQRKKLMIRKQNTTLPADRLIIFLHSKETPKEIISKYLKYITDSDCLLDIVGHLKLYDLGLEYCINKKDMSSLKNLYAKIPTNQVERRTCEVYLNRPVSFGKSNIIVFRSINGKNILQTFNIYT